MRLAHIVWLVPLFLALALFLGVIILAPEAYRLASIFLSFLPGFFWYSVGDPEATVLDRLDWWETVIFEDEDLSPQIHTVGEAVRRDALYGLQRNGFPLRRVATSKDNGLPGFWKALAALYDRGWCVPNRAGAERMIPWATGHDRVLMQHIARHWPGKEG